ncbi:MAG: tetratricopeptide repeat protein [Pyrinomonadaceae bacterium]
MKSSLIRRIVLCVSVLASVSAASAQSLPKGWAHYEDAMSGLSSKAFEKALVSIDKAIAENRGVPGFYVVRARINIALRRTEAAIEDLATAIDKGGDENAYVLTASIGVELNKVETAIEAMDDAVKIAVESGDDELAAKFHVYRAGLNKLVGRENARWADIEKANKLGPPAAADLNAEAWQHFGERAYGMAVVSSLAASQLEPRAAAHFVIRGMAYARLGHQVLALAHFDDAIRLEPANGRAHINRGNLLYHLKRYAESIESINRGLPLVAKDNASWTRLAYQTRALAHCAAGRQADALKDEAEFIKLGGQLTKRCGQ